MYNKVKQTWVSVHALRREERNCLSLAAPENDMTKSPLAEHLAHNVGTVCWEWKATAQPVGDDSIADVHGDVVISMT